MSFKQVLHVPRTGVKLLNDAPQSVRLLDHAQVGRPPSVDRWRQVWVLLPCFRPAVEQIVVAPHQPLYVGLSCVSPVRSALARAPVLSQQEFRTASTERFRTASTEHNTIRVSYARLR